VLFSKPREGKKNKKLRKNLFFPLSNFFDNIAIKVKTLFLSKTYNKKPLKSLPLTRIRQTGPASRKQQLPRQPTEGLFNKPREGKKIKKDLR
jgi:hypothetical protein